MKFAATRRHNTYHTLNVVWGVLTSIFLLLALHFIWQNEIYKIKAQLEVTTQSVRTNVDNFVDNLVQYIRSMTINDPNFTECKNSMLLQRLAFDNPKIAGISVFDTHNKVLCSTLLQKLPPSTPPDSRPLTLYGPFVLYDSDTSVITLQQHVGLDKVSVYVYKQELAHLLKSDVLMINRIALYDSQRQRILLEMTRQDTAQDWEISQDPPPITNTLLEKQSGTFERSSLSNIRQMEIIVELNKEQITLLSLRYFLMAGTVIFLMGFSIYYYFRGLIGQHFSLHRSLVNALKRDEFFPVYQPIINRQLHTCVGAEVLLRWHTGSGETILPDIFIDYAEQSGLIVPMTMKLSRKVFHDCIHLLRANPHFHISINLSANHFTDLHFLDNFIDLCKEFTIPMNQIILEVTERNLLQYDLTLVTKMKKLRSAGFSLAVDDFGTGHASISYLQHFPFNYLKIDRLFILSIGTGAVTEALNQSIIDMAKRLGLHVIAEGVETYQQLEILEENGAYLMQGWYFSRALTFEELKKYIKQHLR